MKIPTMTLFEQVRRAGVVKWLVAFGALAWLAVIGCCDCCHIVGLCALEGTAFGLLLSVLLLATLPPRSLTPLRVVVIVRAITADATAVGLLAGLAKATLAMMG